MRIAMMGAWHVHAPGYARSLRELGAEIVAVWDDDVSRGETLAKEIGCPFVKDYLHILQDESIDSVCVCAATSRHAEILIASAEHGKHIFTEKVLTLTAEDAKRVAAAVEKAGRVFVISYPHMAKPAVKLLKEMADRGDFGRLTYVRVRNTHSGSVEDWLPPHFYSREECGGGAMVDLGAHPMYLIPWFLGRPSAVSSLFTNITERPVEDNAVCLLSFPSGAIGVSETGFVSVTGCYTVEVQGTRGAGRVLDNTVEYSTVETGKQWVRPEKLPDTVYPLPYFADCVQNGNPPVLYTVKEGVLLSEVMDAAYRSEKSGRFEEL